MLRKHNKLLTPLAQSLRKNMTDAEKHLWYDFLKFYPVRFTRQKILGKYIADFYCAQAKLAIELDGSQHYSDRGLSADNERVLFLENEYGIMTLRFSNLDVFQKFQEVCVAIDAEVKKSLHRKRSPSL